MSDEIAVDVDEMLRNIQQMIIGIEDAGIGTRATNVLGLRTPTTAGYMDFGAGTLQAAEAAISQLAVQAGQLRDQIRGVLEEHAKTEGALRDQIQTMLASVDATHLTTVEELGNAQHGYQEQLTTSLTQDTANMFVAPDTDAPGTDGSTP